jgi:hypothetical protein
MQLRDNYKTEMEEFMRWALGDEDLQRIKRAKYKRLKCIVCKGQLNLKGEQARL